MAHTVSEAEWRKQLSAAVMKSLTPILQGKPSPGATRPLTKADKAATPAEPDGGGKVWKVGGVGWLTFRKAGDLPQGQRANLRALAKKAGPGGPFHDPHNTTVLADLLSILLDKWSFGDITGQSETQRERWFVTQLEALPASTVDEMKTTVASALPTLGIDMTRPAGSPKVTPVDPKAMKAELLAKADAADQFSSILARGYRQHADALDAVLTPSGEPFTKAELLAKADETDGALRQGYLDRADRCP